MELLGVPKKLHLSGVLGVRQKPPKCNFLHLSPSGGGYVTASCHVAAEAQSTLAVGLYIFRVGRARRVQHHLIKYTYFYLPTFINLETCGFRHTHMIEAPYSFSASQCAIQARPSPCMHASHKRKHCHFYNTTSTITSNDNKHQQAFTIHVFCSFGIQQLLTNTTSCHVELNPHSKR